MRTASLSQLRMLAQASGAAQPIMSAARTSVLAAAATIDCLSAMLRAKVSRPPSSHTCCNSSSLSPDSTCARRSAALCGRPQAAHNHNTRCSRFLCGVSCMQRLRTSAKQHAFRGADLQGC